MILSSLPRSSSSVDGSQQHHQQDPIAPPPQQQQRHSDSNEVVESLETGLQRLNPFELKQLVRL